MEYYNDIIEALRQLLAGPRLPLAERLRCLAAAADVMSGQGEALTVDRRAFHAQLYRALLALPLQGIDDAGGAPQPGKPFKNTWPAWGVQLRARPPPSLSLPDGAYVYESRLVNF